MNKEAIFHNQFIHTTHAFFPFRTSGDQLDGLYNLKNMTSFPL